MNTIGGIIDMDGFEINKTFYCKEIGLLNMNGEVATSHHFNLPFTYHDLTEKDQKTCYYLFKHVHKLPFITQNSLPLHQLEPVVKNFHEKIGQKVIAYKGGHFERDLLAQLGIPGINLELFGCPKAEQLFDRLIWLETCGQHVGKDPYRHCPKTEVEAFGAWLKEYL